MYNENEISLTEATVLALQGKLKLEETKLTRKSRKTIKKEESVNINTDEVNVSVDDNGDTIVDTDNKTITVSEKVTENPPIEEPIENQETIDVPVEGDEVIVPEEEVSEETVEDIIDEPIEDTENEDIEDLELDESKKVENKGGFSNKVKTEAIEDKEKTKCENCGKEVCECDTIEQPIKESKECLVEDEPKYEWVLQGNYGYGWDDLVTYDSKEEAEADYKDYRENEPEYAHRIRKRLVKEEAKTNAKQIKTESCLDMTDFDSTVKEILSILRSEYSISNLKEYDDGDPIGTELIYILKKSDIEKVLPIVFGSGTNHYPEKDFVIITNKLYTLNEIDEMNTKNSLFASSSKDLKIDLVSDSPEKIASIIADNFNKMAESKDEKIESKTTFNKKSFEEALTKFYKFNSDMVKSFKVESISKNKKGSIKIEGKLNNKVDTIMIFDKLTEGNSYVTYKLRNTNGILKESKDIVTSMFISKKFNNLNCRRIISK